MTCGMAFKTFTARLQRLIGLNKPKTTPAEKRSLQISAPFNFVHETVSLPGVSEDEIAILKEKAAASRLGVVSEGRSSSIGRPRKAPAPPSQPHSVQSAPDGTAAPAEQPMI
ncbi:hypothetical protein GGR56DRAFT_618182 [Xylariaceae sp. FL0804]|nr:hypothetical protein GGR56DRAFT_618182 [Xylariaceae sp. FL0804]